MSHDSSPTDSTSLASFGFDHETDDSTRAEVRGPRAFFGSSMRNCDSPSHLHAISVLGGGTTPAASDLNAILDLGRGTLPAPEAVRDERPDAIKTTPPATPCKPLRCNPICYGFFSPQNSPATTPVCFPACLALTLPPTKVRRAPPEEPGLHDLLEDAINQGSVVLVG